MSGVYPAPPAWPQSATTSQMEEVIERLKRIETRVVKVAGHMGLDLNTRRPSWRENNTAGYVHITSPDESIRNVLNTVPRSYKGDVVVMCYDTVVAQFRIGD